MLINKSIGGATILTIKSFLNYLKKDLRGEFKILLLQPRRGVA